MRFSALISLLSIASCAIAAARRSRRHVGLDDPVEDALDKRQPLPAYSKRWDGKCPSPNRYLNRATERMLTPKYQWDSSDINVSILGKWL